jgi:hypothetical protein
VAFKKEALIYLQSMVDLIKSLFQKKGIAFMKVQTLTQYVLPDVLQRYRHLYS